MRDGLELTVHMGERDRCSDGLLADALMDLFERREVRRSVMLRGAEGFGLRHALHSDRLLSVSEDLPIVAVAVDVPGLIEGMLGEVRELVRHGLITLERVALIDAGDALAETERPAGAARLTVWVARRDRAADGRAAHVAVVDCMRRHGLHSASVLLGLDGTADGRRRRARLLGRNRHVPLPVLAIGEGHAVGAAVPEIAAMLDGAEMTLEAVDVLKRDGVLLGAPPRARAPREAAEPARWQKLVVHATERSVGHGEAPHGALVRRLRDEGAAGATVLHGHWGFQGAGLPQGERFWSLARDVPALTLVLDTPARMVRWLEIVDEMTAADALVTSERVSVGS